MRIFKMRTRGIISPLKKEEVQAGVLSNSNNPEPAYSRWGVTRMVLITFTRTKDTRNISTVVFKVQIICARQHPHILTLTLIQYLGIGTKDLVAITAKEAAMNCSIS